MMMYRMEKDSLPPTSYSVFTPASNPPLSDLTQYINPHVKNNRVQNAIGNHVQGVVKQPKPDTYKTVMCQAWLESMKCAFGENCKFAHGEKELRPAKVPIRNHMKYKTKLCEKYANGICPYGSRCLFIHPDLTTKPPTIAVPSLFGSEKSSPASVGSSLDQPLSPTANPLRSIWGSDPNVMQQPVQTSFNKSGGPKRLPIYGAGIGSSSYGAIGGALDSSLLFNQTAEAMVSFLWA